MKKNIAVIYGGDSSEVEISIKSGKNVLSIIDTQLFNVFPILYQNANFVIDTDEKICIDKNDFSFSHNNIVTKIDCAVIVIHGTPGENGIMESYFDMLKIPYTTCSALVSALTFNKYYCNTYLRHFKINMANSLIIRKKEEINIEAVIEKLKLPIFVKPSASGSSFGISKVKIKEDLLPAILRAFQESEDVILEEFISGTEVTCGLLRVNNEFHVFPLCMIISGNEFFDYEAKYNPELSQEILPAPIDDKLTAKCKEESVKIYTALNCRGIVRIDYILKDDTFYFLEINTIPGMTSASLVPKMIEYSKTDITKLYTCLITEAIAEQR